MVRASLERGEPGTQSPESILCPRDGEGDNIPVSKQHTRSALAPSKRGLRRNRMFCYIVTLSCNLYAIV
jgi:hypothetical protein